MHFSGKSMGIWLVPNRAWRVFFFTSIASIEKDEMSILILWVTFAMDSPPEDNRFQVDLILPCSRSYFLLYSSDIWFWLPFLTQGQLTLPSASRTVPAWRLNEFSRTLIFLLCPPNPASFFSFQLSYILKSALKSFFLWYLYFLFKIYIYYF